MATKRLAAFCGFAALWICTLVQAASVRAWLDRNSMQLGETVTLNVQVDGDTSAPQPDFSALQADFELTGTQSSTSVNIVNGQSSAAVLWAVGLAPRRAGTFTIPALDVDGQKTQPLTLVVQVGATGAAAQGGDAWIEVHAEPPSPYVQQQVTLTVKLYYAVQLIDGNLSDPRAPDLVVRRMGQDSNYTTQAAGRSYRVVERRYALFAEKSGSLQIPPLVFRGHALDGNSGGFFFNQGRDVGARSSPLELQVRTRPAASGKDAWLPARSVTLTASGIDAAASARVGEPLTLDLRLQAQGLSFEQLPKLELPPIPGADIYPDKPDTQNRDDGQWLYGTRQRKFAVVPNRAGALTLPAISIQWWDTAHDQLQTASVPAVTVQVAAAAASPAAAPPAATTPAAAAPPVVPVGNAGAEPAPDVSPTLPWRDIALIALVLWALTLAAWIARLLQQRRAQARTAVVREPDATSAKRAFADACKHGDWPRAAASLLHWAQRLRPTLRNLDDLAHQLRDSRQTQAIAALERACYGTAIQADLGRMLIDAFASGPAWRDAATARSEPILPELYPPHA